MITKLAPKRGGGVLTPPYGSSKALIEALHLMRDVDPRIVDSDFLRQHRIAPSNEYKVVGGLRFLGLINEDGRPTERGSLLKFGRKAYLSNLRDAVEEAYDSLFQWFGTQKPNLRDAYNYFDINEEDPEMARKAVTAFFGLCQEAGIEIGGSRRLRLTRKRRVKERFPRAKVISFAQGKIPDTPFVLVLTQETAGMSQEKLTGFLKRVRKALEDSLEGGE